MHKWSLTKVSGRVNDITNSCTKNKSTDDDLILKTSRLRLVTAGDRAFTIASPHLGTDCYMNCDRDQQVL